MTSSHGVGTQSPTCALAEYGTASGLVHSQPKPVSILLFYLWLSRVPEWGAKWRRLFSIGSWWYSVEPVKSTSIVKCFSL